MWLIFLYIDFVKWEIENKHRKIFLFPKKIVNLYQIYYVS